MFNSGLTHASSLEYMYVGSPNPSNAFLIISARLIPIFKALRMAGSDVTLLPTFIPFSSRSGCVGRFNVKEVIVCIVNTFILSTFAFA